MGITGVRHNYLLPTTVGRLRKTCWSSRWVGDMRPTESAIQLIARFSGADSLGPKPADHDAERLDRLARGFLTERLSLAADERPRQGSTYPE